MLDPGRKPGRAARPHGADRAEGQGRSPLLGGPPPALTAALPAGDPAPSTSRPATGACPRVCLCCDSSSGRHVLGSPGSHPPWVTASVPTAGFASCVLICHLLVSTRGGSSSIGGEGAWPALVERMARRAGDGTNRAVQWPKRSAAHRSRTRLVPGSGTFPAGRALTAHLQPERGVR